MAESVCPACGGSGWKIVERDGVSAAERCECAAAERMSHLEEKAGIPPLYRGASLDNFKLPADNPIAHRQLATVLLTVRSYVREFPQPKQPGLLLIGETGVGKTHLAVAALRLLIARGFAGVFFDYLNLLDRIRSGWDASAGASNREAYSAALESELLLLDDLGAHRTNEWIEDTVASIITYRCNNEKPLIATTNLPDAAAGDALVTRTDDVTGVRYRVALAERIGERARSRLFEMCRVVRMPAVGDYRLRGR
ncbi:MAG: ATP-binding protein [Acidobacteriota bacterium]